MLEIDVTLFFQIADFLLLLILLNILLYKPVRNIIRQRNEQVSSLQATVEDLSSKAQQEEVALKENVALARKEGFKEKENLKAQGIEEEKSIVQQAMTQAEQKVGAARSEIETTLAEVRKTLEEQVSIFSKELAEKILGRTVQ